MEFNNYQNVKFKATLTLLLLSCGIANFSLAEEKVGDIFICLGADGKKFLTDSKANGSCKLLEVPKKSPSPKVIKMTNSDAINYAKKSVLHYAVDPESVKFRDMRMSFSGKHMCGSFNAKNSFGGYNGFRTFAVKLQDSDYSEVIVLENVYDFKNICLDK